MPKFSSLVLATAFVATVGFTAPPPALAQRAAVRVGAGRPSGFRPAFRSPVFIGGFGFGYPYFYDPWGYGYPYGYGFGDGYGYEGYGGYDVASLRLEITPKQAEVYVDGYRAGIVDNFDGIFQRLHVRPGGHDLTVYLPGYRTFETNVYANPSATQTIKMNLLPLRPGESTTPPPMPAPPQAAPAPGYGRGGNMRMMPPVPVGPGGSDMQPQGPPPPPNMAPPPPPNMAAPPPMMNDGQVPPPMPTDPAAYGTLTLRVQPTGGMGTLILIDGERWATPNSSDQLLVRLAEGKHHVEIRRPGFAPFVTDVDIQRGSATPLNVSLVRR